MFQVIIVASCLVLLSADLMADFHVIYENHAKKGQKLELFVKNRVLKVISAQNEVKIADLDGGNLYLFKKGDKKYLRFEFSQNSNHESKEGSQGEPPLFNSALAPLGERKNISGQDANLVRYRSEIDEPVRMYVTHKYAGEITSTIQRGLAHVSVKGIEPLKEPAYYYALENGLLPLAMSGEDFDWEAVKVSEEPLGDLLSVPRGMTLQSVKDYYQTVVEKVAEGMDSKTNP